MFGLVCGAQDADEGADTHPPVPGRKRGLAGLMADDAAAKKRKASSSSQSVATHAAVSRRA